LVICLVFENRFLQIAQKRSAPFSIGHTDSTPCIILHIFPQNWGFAAFVPLESDEMFHSSSFTAQPWLQIAGGQLLCLFVDEG